MKLNEHLSAAQKTQRGLKLVSVVRISFDTMVLQREMQVVVEVRSQPGGHIDRRDVRAQLRYVVKTSVELGCEKRSALGLWYSVTERIQICCGEQVSAPQSFENVLGPHIGECPGMCRHQPDERSEERRVG